MLITAFLTAGFLLGQTSCCDDKVCYGADDLWEIEFYNFSRQDLDTIILTSYIKSTNFTSPVDSSAIEVIDSLDNFFTVYTFEKLNTGLDYKINLTSTGQVFGLTEFEVKRRTCQDCFSTKEYYNALDGYYVNGIKQTVVPLRIYN